MLVTTMNDIPGATITSVIGEVSGLTVRARNIGAQIGAGFKALGGGELKGLTLQLEQTRAEGGSAADRGGTGQGANAVVAMRYDSNELDQNFQEVVAYGTAVVISS